MNTGMYSFNDCVYYRLFAMNREVKLKELQLLDAARRKFLHFQRTQRETELKRLDDEVQRKVGL